MTDNSECITVQYFLPDGLPECFSHSKEGDQLLMEVLGVTNRRERQAMVHAPAVWKLSRIPTVRRLLNLVSSSKREKILLNSYYSIAEERRALFNREFCRLVRWRLHAPPTSLVSAVPSENSIRLISMTV